MKYLSIFPFVNTHNELRSSQRGVAQLGSAGALGALGRRFESCRPDWVFKKERLRLSDQGAIPWVSLGTFGLYLQPF